MRTPRTLKEIRDNIKDTTHETDIDDLIDQYINLTLQEIQSPSWAFTKGNQKGYHHRWSFNKRKDTFETVESTEFYQLPRDLDSIALVRQTSTPRAIVNVPDDVFYRYIPDPDAEGSPIYYRIWEQEGVSTRLSTADTVTIVSSSTSDITEKVSIVGEDANGIKQSEELTLNGTTAVPGTITYVTGKPIRISKSANTVGDITVKEATAGTTLVVVGREERSPRFKIMGLYPIPSSEIDIYLEYYTRIRWLQNETDVADIDEKWIHVVRTGALTKVYQYQNKPADQLLAYGTIYRDLVQSMVKADINEPDYIPHLERHIILPYAGKIEIADEQYSLIF